MVFSVFFFILGSHLHSFWYETSSSSTCILFFRSFPMFSVWALLSTVFFFSFFIVITMGRYLEHCNVLHIYCIIIWLGYSIVISISFWIPFFFLLLLLLSMKLVACSECTLRNRAEEQLNNSRNNAFNVYENIWGETLCLHLIWFSLS